MAKVSKGTERLIKLDLIDEPAEADRLDVDMDEVRSLAGNIKEVGLLQAILIRSMGERYEIIFGHRRYLAHKVLGEGKIRATVKDISDCDAALLRASENLLDVDLSCIEEALIYAKLEDRFGMSHDEIGKRFGKSPGIVKRRLDLLKMPEQLQKAVHRKDITYGVAEELWRISDIGQMEYYLSFAVEHGVTVAVARVWVKDWKDSLRRSQTDVGGGGGDHSPLESKPIYVPCDLCSGPMVLGSEKVLRMCPECYTTLRSAVVGGNKE